MKEIYKTSILKEIIRMIILRIENKQFSSKFNRDKHERIKGYFHRDARPVREILFNDATKVYMWDFRWCSCRYLGSSRLLDLRYFNGNYLKPFRSRNIFFKKFVVLPMSVIITPEEVYDTYVEIGKNMLLEVKIYILIQKAKV